ncbi:hypothetical protein B0H12DRAFT_1078109 [Mycena haematopus]|nr:hypothetical protein B0H12DRAFT_1078109 [Mycena haematopus]
MATACGAHNEHAEKENTDAMKTTLKFAGNILAAIQGGTNIHGESSGMSVSMYSTSLRTEPPDLKREQLVLSTTSTALSSWDCNPRREQLVPYRALLMVRPFAMDTCSNQWQLEEGAAPTVYRALFLSIAAARVSPGARLAIEEGRGRGRQKRREASVHFPSLPVLVK